MALRIAYKFSCAYGILGSPLYDYAEESQPLSKLFRR